MAIKEGYTQILFQVPKHIHRGFKTACSKEGQKMTTVITSFMENYAWARNTFQEASLETAAINDMRDLGILGED